MTDRIAWTASDEVRRQFEGIGEDWRAASNELTQYFADVDAVSRPFAELLSKAIRMRHAVIEGACQAALITGTHGVLIDGNTVSVTTDVPFGEIHYTDKVEGIVRGT